ncbi:DUF7088 domain-containing protein [Flavobacterium piscinae]|uniref:DUF7088 domain-containing protein n=1 Tax=Flavobacterium piscinae TaxID=2506424 RepID=UPI002AAAC3C5|nr:Gldg family protein [Flavobacterium piscinae]
MNSQTKKTYSRFYCFFVLILLNIAGNFYFKRFDLTQDKRYTLSESTIKLIENIQEPVFIDVFLDGNFPPEFKRLQNETRQILEEFRSHNSNLIFQFTNPLEDESQAQQYVEELIKLGFMPTNINSNKKGKKK